MKCYLLRRDNQDSGPYTLGEIKSLGLKVCDAVWIEGLSTRWQNPSDIEELKNLIQYEKNTSSSGNKAASANKTNMMWGLVVVLLLILSGVLTKQLVDGFQKRTKAAASGRAILDQIHSLPEDAIPDPSFDGSVQHALTIEIVPVDTLQAKKPFGKVTLKELMNQVKLECTAYEIDVLGSIHDLRLTISNNSLCPLDSVTIKVEYVKPNGKTIKAKELVLHDIAPKSKRKLDIPAGNADVEVKSEIINITVKEFKPVLVQA